MAVRKGLDAVKESAESKSFTGGNRRYFKWTAGERKCVRFLTDGDDIVLTTLHEYVTCHNGSKRSFVCRGEFGAACELCADPDVRKRDIAYGVALWREPKTKNNETVIGTRVEEVKVNKDGKEVTEIQPWVGIVQQAPRNFWNWFWSVHQTKGTIVDRDFWIERTGADKNTDYSAFPEDKSELDLSKFAEFVPDLEEMVTYLGSQEYYDKWLHNIAPTKADAVAEAAEDAIPNEEDLAILRQANAEAAADATSAFD